MVSSSSVLSTLCLILVAGQVVLADEVGDLLGLVACRATASGYLLPDRVECDRFAKCAPYTGYKTLHYCPFGQGLSLTDGSCRPLDQVDCGSRIVKRNQSQEEAVLRSSHRCPEMNGLFAVNGSCIDFVDCRDGKEYAGHCAPHTVFEPSMSACVHPDQTSRSDCSGPTVHSFRCPNRGSLPIGLLRFGDHDRLAHPSDCSKFFACLLNGQPRLSSCPPPTVFDPATGFCTYYTLVKGCSTFYDHLTEELKAIEQSALKFRTQ